MVPTETPKSENIPVPRGLTHSVNTSGGPTCAEFYYSHGRYRSEDSQESLPTQSSEVKKETAEKKAGRWTGTVVVLADSQF